MDRQYKAIRAFVKNRPNAKDPLDTWYDIVAAEKRRHIGDVKAQFPAADAVGRCTVFDIGGNKYRLVTWIEYHFHKIDIRAILTRKEYDEEKWKSDC